jgi:hypothetical protein
VSMHAVVSPIYMSVRDGVRSIRLHTACLRVRHSLYTAIDVTHIYRIYIHDKYIHLHLCGLLHQGIYKCKRFAVQQIRAHVCIHVSVCSRLRVYLGAPASAPKHASAFRGRRPRVARLAGAQLCVGVQREHRRVEHRVGHHVVRGMRCFRPERRATAGGTRIDR